MSRICGRKFSMISSTFLSCWGRGRSSKAASNKPRRSYGGCEAIRLPNPGVSASCGCAQCTWHGVQYRSHSDRRRPDRWNQKFLDGCAVFDLKLGSHMLDRNFQAPHHIAVFFQQFPGIMVQGFSATSFSTNFFMVRPPCSILRDGRECKFKSGDLPVPAQNRQAKTER